MGSFSNSFHAAKASWKELTTPVQLLSCGVAGIVAVALSVGPDKTVLLLLLLLLLVVLIACGGKVAAARGVKFLVSCRSRPFMPARAKNIPPTVA